MHSFAWLFAEGSIVTPNHRQRLRICCRISLLCSPMPLVKTRHSRLQGVGHRGHVLDVIDRHALLLLERPDRSLLMWR